jgi:hypothetical protein
VANLATIVLDVEKGVEVGAADLLKFLNKAKSAEPAVVAAIGILAGALTASLAGVQAAAGSSGLNLALDEQAIADLKLVWPAVQKFLETLGVKFS